MKKLFVCAALLLASLSPMAVKANDDFIAAAEHAIAVELNTGRVLYEKDATTPDGIASITKIMTAYMVYEAIDLGKLQLSDQVAISDYAYDLTVNTAVSNVPMDARSYTVEELLDALMIASANSAAIALAEHIAGSEPAFVDMMQAKLKEWGIGDATLVNASGLNNEFLGANIYPGSSPTDENLMSAYGVAIIAKHLIEDHPEILEVSSKTMATFDGKEIYTYNYMLPDQPYFREGIDGLKTGTTALAGESFVATTTENGLRLITVILNADNAGIDQYARFTATNGLLNYIRDNFKLTTFLKKGQSYQKSKAIVHDGKAKTVEAVAKEDFKVVTKVTADPELQATGQFGTPAEGFTAKVKAGDLVGSLSLVDPQLTSLGYLGETPTVEMVAKEDIQRSFFLKVWWNHFVTYVNEKL